MLSFDEKTTKILAAAEARQKELEKINEGASAPRPTVSETSETDTAGLDRATIRARFAALSAAEEQIEFHFTPPKSDRSRDDNSLAPVPAPRKTSGSSTDRSSKAVDFFAPKSYVTPKKEDPTTGSAIIFNRNVSNVFLNVKKEEKLTTISVTIKHNNTATSASTSTASSTRFGMQAVPSQKMPSFDEKTTKILADAVARQKELEKINEGTSAPRVTVSETSKTGPAGLDRAKIRARFAAGSAEEEQVGFHFTAPKSVGSLDANSVAPVPAPRKASGSSTDRSSKAVDFFAPRKYVRPNPEGPPTGPGSIFDRNVAFPFDWSPNAFSRAKKEEKLATVTTTIKRKQTAAGPRPPKKPREHAVPAICTRCSVMKPCTSRHGKPLCEHCRDWFVKAWNEFAPGHCSHPIPYDRCRRCRFDELVSAGLKMP